MNQPNAANGPPPTRLGDCIYCGKHAQVRTFKPPGQHPPVQACFGCRPLLEPIQPRKFAVLYGPFAYLIQAPNKELAAAFMQDEINSIDRDDEWAACWDASHHSDWIAAWRRGAVIEIRDRKLPADIE